MDDGALLTVEQVADRLGVSRYQVYRRIGRGDLPAVLTQGRWTRYLIDAADLEVYIAAGGIDVLSPPGVRDGSLLRVSEVAAMTGLTVDAVRVMCKQGRLPYSRGVGRNAHFRIPLWAVEKLQAPARR